MKNKSRISFGPGAASLILIVVILSMSILGILALMNARNDSQLSAHSAEVIAAVYQLNDAAERSLARLDAAAEASGRRAETDEAYLLALQESLPEGMEMAGRMVAWEETDGLRLLECEAEVLPLGSDNRLAWRTHRLTAVTEDIWN